MCISIFVCYLCSDHSQCEPNSCGPLAECDSEGVCTYIDECQRDGALCGSNSNCTNTPGSHICTCLMGFNATNPSLPPGSSNECTDIDECVEDATICGPLSNCTNSIGSHICACFLGYRENNPEMIASSVNPCTGKGITHLYSCIFYFCVIKSLHHFSTDIDECSETPGICGFQTVCTNVPATFYCSCPDGFYPSTGILWTVGVSFLSGVGPRARSRKVGSEGDGETGSVILGISDRLVSAMVEPGQNQTRTSVRSSTVGKTYGLFVVLLTVSVMLTSSPGSAAAAFLTLNGMESLLSHQYFKTENRTEMYSDVITAVLPSVNNTNLTEPVNFTKLPGDGMVTCVYWEGKTSTMRWSVDGCWVAYTTDNYTVCSCSHLSTFALIMQIGEWLNRMCVIVGLFFFALAILTFLLCSWNPKINNTARLHLCLSLSLSHLLLLTPWPNMTSSIHWSSQLACTVMAGILHFLVVASFVWMQLEAMQLYLLVRRLTKVQVIQRDGLPRPLLYVIGYGVPFVIVGVSALVYSDGYGATEAGACWLSQRRNFNWALTGPVITILAVSVLLNLVICLSYKKLFSHSSLFTLTLYHCLIYINLTMFKIVAQFVILGCTWILGLYQTNLFFQVLFIILNSQQGTFLFIVHCLLNKEVDSPFLLICSLISVQYSSIAK
uniref:Adhesion G protein-coupled receptor E8 n=1 Tax=Sphaeramia orbicularis TaxID=375764 RepID=A0A672YIJ3_9TELE